MLVRLVDPHQDDPFGPPSIQPAMVRFSHPENNIAFVSLPAYDPTGIEGQYGIHLRTALVACQIIAFNKPGYLTAVRERTGDRITGLGDLDHVIPAGTYYYHLEVQEPNRLYPICRDFRRWPFPHELPQEWMAPDDVPPNDIVPGTWSVVSDRVKVRDKKCLVTGARDSLTTAHVVPRAQEAWVCGIARAFFFADVFSAMVK
jgi:hypothetical protein